MTPGPRPRPRVEVHGLSKRYGEFEALSGLELVVEPGQVFALLGPNGAGKTTTIRILMGILQPTAGTATVAGLDCFRDRVEVKRLVGYLPDEPVFYDYLRGGELVRFVGQMHGLTRDEIADRSEPLLARLQIADAVDEFAVNYSRGMKKKLALLCALLHDPPVLLLDEPTNGLDPHATRTVHELMKERAAGGRTVFFSTHLLDQAERLCDRAAIIAGGRAAAAGTLDELRAQGSADESLEAIFFRLTEAPAAAAAGAEP